MRNRFVLMALLGAIAAFAPIPSLPCEAQEVHLPGADNIFFEMVVLETTHIGAFDTYIGKSVGKSKGGGGSGGEGGDGGPSRWWDIVFPEGTPNNLKWKWLERPGFRLAIGYSLPAPAWALRGSMEISAFLIHEENAVNVLAPTGLGIFYDPARLYLRARFWGAGTSFMMPLGQRRIGTARLNLSAGAGGIAYVSHTSMKVTSAFLDLHFKKTRYRIRPLLSAALRVRWLDVKEDKRPFTPDLSFRIEAFPTDHFWTVSLQAGFLWRF